MRSTQILLCASILLAPLSAAQDGDPPPDGDYSALTGPVDLDRYPEAASSPYLLPWTGGDARQCIQGNRGVVSHKGNGRFAFDFAMPIGTTVRAARGGTVVAVVDHHARRGSREPNNAISIDHGDGTFGWYLHLEQGGARVAVGDAVERGQPIAASGNVGRSLVPHLHFHVADGEGRTLPIAFADTDRGLRSDRGVPRMFRRYVSDNGSGG